MFRRRPFVTALAVGYFVALCFVALGPRADGQFDYLGGVLMFLPLGPLVVGLLGRRHWIAALMLGLVASIWIQLACIVWRPDVRIASSDLSANLTGVVIGTLVAVAIGALVAKRSRSRALSFTRFSQTSGSGLTTETHQD